MSEPGHMQQTSLNYNVNYIKYSALTSRVMYHIFKLFALLIWKESFWNFLLEFVVFTCIFVTCFDSNNSIQFSPRCPPKWTNHTYSHWFLTELKNRFWRQPIANWLERNDMVFLFRTLEVLCGGIDGDELCKMYAFPLSFILPSTVKGSFWGHKREHTEMIVKQSNEIECMIVISENIFKSEDNQFI